MNPRLFQSIAKRVNEQFRLNAHVVTADQVALVAGGQERTVSHPVIASIAAELRAKKIKIL